MNKKLLTVKTQIPTWEDNFNNEYIDFGNVLSTYEDVKNYFLSFDDIKKQELFDDYKEYLEGTHTNRVNFNLDKIDVEEMCEIERKILNKVKSKYKFDINKLIKLFYNEPLKNSYEFNLSRGFEQNFLKLETTYTTSSSKEIFIDTKYLVLEINKFNFDVSNIYVYDLSYTEL